MNQVVKQFRTCLKSTFSFQPLTRIFLQGYCTSSSGLPVLTLYTKDPCPLCDEALNELAPHLHKVQLEKVDITKPENRQWWKAYKYDIPVFHLNGNFLMKHKADIERFTSVLNEIKHKDSKS